MGSEATQIRPDSVGLSGGGVGGVGGVPEILAASKSYADEALEVIAEIMRKSDNEKTRLLAAGLLLDRAGERRPAGPAPLRVEGDLGVRIRAHLTNHYMRKFSAETIRTDLALRSPESVVSERLKQMVAHGQIRAAGPGMFQALPP